MPHSNARADGPAPIQYTVRFPRPASHYAEVEALVPTSGASSVTLMMAVWTPGSYLVREYSRNVENVEAFAHESESTTPLTVDKVRKNRWSIATGGAATVRVSYRVYAREMGVQSNWVDSGFALLNGAPTFLTLADEKAPRVHQVEVELPRSWSRAISGLPSAEEGKPNVFVASSYDVLVDSPIYAGNPAVYEFEVDGKPHLLVNEGEEGVWDGPRSARDTEAIVRAQRDFWGQIPYERYVFFNLLTEAGGGLEHCNSTVLMASRWATRKRESYLNWLNLVSHEFFHTWNVKRLRPAELGPFDYENEVFTRSLWVAEGITSYYDRIFVRRAGLCSTEELLAGDPPGGGEDRARSDIERLQETPGRLVQPLEAASQDAWIKFYRRDENTNNTAISYYVKGSVVAWLLDARIREATQNAKSLDDVMRLAYDRYSGTTGFTPEEFQATAAEVAGVDLASFFHRALHTTGELDYRPALAWFGLQFTDRNGGKSAEARPKPKKAWPGLDTRNDAGRLVVTQVKRDTPAFDAGFNVNDEILAVNDFRIRPDQPGKYNELFEPGETVKYLIARRDRLMTLELTLGVETRPSFAIEIDPTATDSQKQSLEAWLGKTP